MRLHTAMPPAILMGPPGYPPGEQQPPPMVENPSCGGYLPPFDEEQPLSGEEQLPTAEEQQAPKEEQLLAGVVPVQQSSLPLRAPFPSPVPPIGQPLSFP